MKLSKLIKSMDVLDVAGPENVKVLGVAYDSREVKEGWLFVAVSGHQVDGSAFITQAVSNGAVAVVSESALHLGSGVAHVQVPCARTALAEIAHAFYGKISKDLSVIGVTGTNGKTTTTYMIRDMLRCAGRRPGLLGTVAYEVGNRSIPASRTTPEAPEIHSMFRQMADAGCDAAVLEVSSHALELRRVHKIDFDVAVFTNLTQDHLDYHKDMETYFDVKAMLFERLKKTGRCAVINCDDPWGRRLIDEKAIRAEVMTYGFGEKAMVRACDATLDASGTDFKVETPWGDADVHLQLLGRFNIHNALAALAVGGVLGLELHTMVKALAGIAAVPGRLELVANPGGRQIFVDYAHTDDALKNVLTTLREICAGRLLVVFGCGGNRDTGKREKMGRAAAELADFSIVTSDNPRNEEPAAIVADILNGFSNPDQYEVVLDRREAIEKGVAMMGERDVLLIAGKGHETYQEFDGAVVPFDDREMVKGLFQ